MILGDDISMALHMPEWAPEMAGLSQVGCGSFESTSGDSDMFAQLSNHLSSGMPYLFDVDQNQRACQQGPGNSGINLQGKNAQIPFTQLDIDDKDTALMWYRASTSADAAPHQADSHQPCRPAKSELETRNSRPSLHFLNPEIETMGLPRQTAASAAAMPASLGCSDLPEPKRKKRRTMGYRSSQDSGGESSSSTTISRNSSFANFARPVTSENNTMTQNQQSINYRFWSLEETEALVEGVARCGNGKWAVIKKLSFAAIEKRSPVDLKDKWRNLTRIAMLPPDQVKQDKKRDMACPPELLKRVREIHSGQAAARPRSPSDSGSSDSYCDTEFAEFNSELASGDFLLSGHGMFSSEDDKAFVLPQTNAQADLLSSFVSGPDPFSMVETTDACPLLPAWLSVVGDLLDGTNDLAFPHEEQQVPLMPINNFPSGNLVPSTIPLYSQQLVPLQAPSGYASDWSPESIISAETSLASPAVCGTKLAETKKVNDKQMAPAVNEMSRFLPRVSSDTSTEMRTTAVMNNEEPDVDTQVHGESAENKQEQNISYRFWSLEETEALVEGVARCGNGKWAVIKKLSFAAIEKRSPVDLKDKWRNLTRIAMLPPDQVKQDKKRDMACPPELLKRVREIAKLEASKKQTGKIRRRSRGQTRERTLGSSIV